MVRTQISLTEEQAEGLRRLAALRRRSQAALMREAVDQLLSAGDEEQHRIERARAVVGAFSSGGASGRDHDETFVDSVLVSEGTP